MTVASPEIGSTEPASPPPWADGDPGMARAVTWYEANRHREDLPMLLRVMELEAAMRKVVPPTNPGPVPPRTGAAMPPEILSLGGAAELIGMSADWLKRQHKRMPEGVVIQRAKRCALCFRRGPLREWRDGGRVLAPPVRKGRK